MVETFCGRLPVFACFWLREIGKSRDLLKVPKGLTVYERVDPSRSKAYEMALRLHWRIGAAIGARKAPL